MIDYCCSVRFTLWAQWLDSFHTDSLIFFFLTSHFFFSFVFQGLGNFHSIYRAHKMPILQCDVKPLTFNFNIINYLYAFAGTHTYTVWQKRKMHEKQITSCFNKRVGLFLYSHNFFFICRYVYLFRLDRPRKKKQVHFKQLLIFAVQPFL